MRQRRHSCQGPAQDALISPSVTDPVSSARVRPPPAACSSFAMAVASLGDGGALCTGERLRVYLPYSLLFQLKEILLSSLHSIQCIWTWSSFLSVKTEGAESGRRRLRAQPVGGSLTSSIVSVGQRSILYKQSKRDQHFLPDSGVPDSTWSTLLILQVRLPPQTLTGRMGVLGSRPFRGTPGGCWELPGGHCPS